MANYHTELSFAIHNISAEEEEWIKVRLEGDDAQWPQYEFAEDSDGVVLWVHEEEGCDIEDLANLLQQFLSLFRPADSIGFSWADTCSKPRLDSFGGGAVFITAVTQEWVSLWEWLKERGV